MKLKGKQAENFIEAVNKSENNKKSDEECISYKYMNVEEIKAIYESKKHKNISNSSRI
jgi:hypothetical protein